MKKLLGVSIAAMLAVTPMIASADPASGDHLSNAAPTATTGNAPFKAVTVDTDANIATTSYVQGAYNDAIAAINKVATTAGAAQTVDQVKTAIGNAAGDGLSGDTTNGKLELDVAANKAIQLVGETAGSKELDLVLADGTLTQNSSGLKVGTISDSNITDGTISQSKINGLSTTFGTKQDKLTNGSANISTTVATTMRTDTTGENAARNDVLVTESAVAAALATVNSLADAAQTAQEVEDKIDAAAGAGLATDGQGVLSVTAGDGIQVADDKVAAKLHTGGGLDIDSTSKGIKVVVDGTTIENSNGTLQVKSGVYDASGAASNAQTAIETKLTTGGGATGYAINAQSLQVQGSDVSTQTGVTATISNSTVPVFTAWGADTTTNVYVKSAAYTTTARENGVAAN